MVKTKLSFSYACTAACICPAEWTGPSCNQCAPARAGAVYIYGATGNKNGNHGGRAGADARALAALPASLPGLPGATYRARGLVSLQGDARADFPQTYCVPSDVPVYAIKADGTTTRLADNWADLVDGTIQATLTNALGLPSTAYIWTGTTNTGAASGNDCFGWTAMGVNDPGTAAPVNRTTNWLAQGSAGCQSVARLLGVAYCVDSCP